MAKENEKDLNETGPLLPSSNEADENKENQDGMITQQAEKLADMKLDVPPSVDIEKVTADLLQSRTDLLGRVQTLKKDLQDWRGKLDSQVKTYRQELGELRTTLNSEVEKLRIEFQALRSTLKRQLDTTNGLAELGPTTSPERVGPITSPERLN